MTFKTVKLKNLDTKSPYFYPNRTTEIVMRDGSINTPDRAATLYEYNQKGKIPSETTIDNKISFSIKKINSKGIIELLTTNGPYNSLLKYMEESDDMMKYSIFRGHLIEPTSTPQDNDKGEKIDSGIEYLQKNSNERNRFLRFIVKVQKDIGLDIITIPYLALGFSDYCNLVKDITNNLRKTQHEPLFIFDLDYENNIDKFSNMISFFINDIGIQLLGFRNKSFSRHAVSYDILSQYLEKDVVFFSFDVDRSDDIHANISTMHYFPFLATDIYAIKKPQFIDNKKQGNTKKSTRQYQLKKENIKFFNPQSLIIEPSLTRLKDPEKILEEIKESSNENIQRILYNHTEIDDNKNKMNILKSLSKVHELKSSTAEFENLKKMIKSDESTEYIKSKDHLKNTLDSFKKR